jgi:hypothetical protein
MNTKLLIKEIKFKKKYVSWLTKKRKSYNFFTDVAKESTVMFPVDYVKKKILGI